MVKIDRLPPKIQEIIRKIVTSMEYFKLSYFLVQSSRPYQQNGGLVWFLRHYDDFNICLLRISHTKRSSHCQSWSQQFFSLGLCSGISQDTFSVCLQSGIWEILGLTSGSWPSSPKSGVSGWAFLVVLVVVAWKSETVLTKIFAFPMKNLGNVSCHVVGGG